MLKDKRQQTVFLIGVMLLALLTAIVFLLLFQLEESTVKVARLESFPIGNSSEIMYQINEEGVYDDQGTRVIPGWAVKPGKVYPFYNYGNDAYRERVYNNMHLGYTDGINVYILPTKLSKNEDVNTLINNGIDYSYCGFSAFLPDSIRNIKEKNPVLIWQNLDGTKELFYLEQNDVT